MSIGKLRDRVRLRVAVTSDDGMGGQVTRWTDGPDVWAEVMPLQGRELYQAQAVTPVISHRVRTRHRQKNDLGPTQRLQWRGRELEIHAVREADNKREYLMLDCGLLSTST